MTRCPKPEMWVRYAAGELADRPRRALQTHLESCDACRREVRDLARGLEAMESLEREPALRPEMLDTLHRRLRVAAANRSTRPRVITLVARYGWAAAAAAVLVAALVLNLPKPTPTIVLPGNHQAESLQEVAAAIELLRVADNGTTPLPPQNLFPGGRANELNLFLELDDAGLLLDYLMSQDRLQG